MIIDNESLKKTYMNDAEITNFMVSPMPDAEKTIKDIQKAIKKAKKNGWTNIRIDSSYDPGDENSLPRSYIVLYGTRIETDEEWEIRLRRQNFALKRELEDLTIKSMPSYLKSLRDKMHELDKALSKSPLKCKVCGSAGDTFITCGAGVEKSTRLCKECSKKINDKYYGSINRGE